MLISNTGEISGRRSGGFDHPDFLCSDHCLHDGPRHCMEASVGNDSRTAPNHNLLLLQEGPSEKYVEKGHQISR